MPPTPTGRRRSPVTLGAAVLALLAASLTVGPVSPASAAQGVLALDDSTKVNRAARALVVPTVNDVRGNLTLPATGADDTTVTWTSDHPGVIGTDGVVRRPAPGAENVRVNLIATVKLNQASSARTFEALVPALPAPQALKGYLFSYFTGKGKQFYAALSEGNNPLKFRELNAGRPVLTSTLGEMGRRDPFIIRSPEGDKFYQIATDLRIGNDTKSIMVWESTDLVNWTDQRLVEVSSDTAGDTWAPEAYYDDELGAYVVFWASKTDVMMHATTRDFVTFSAPKVWVDERADTSIFKSNTEQKWYLYRDEAGSRGYVPFESTDLSSGTWTPSTGFSLPASLRHGTVLPITQAEYDRILRKYPPAEPVKNTTPVTVLPPDAGGDVKGSEGSAIQLDGTSAGDGPVAWTYRPADGVDAGATCAFADATRASTTITCTDDGEFEVTLTAGAVSDKATMTVRDSLPEIVKFAAPATATVGEPVTLRLRFTDAGSNDTHSCLAFVHPLGESLEAKAENGACTFTHTYRAAGRYPLVAAVLDGKVSVFTGARTIRVAPANSADAGPDATGAEGSAIQLAGRTTGAANPAWSYRPLSGVDTGATCEFADAESADPTFTCTDDGTYEVRLTVGKAKDKARVTVVNELPVITAARNPASVQATKPVGVSATFTDAGKHDTHACTVDWTGGVTSAGTVTGGKCKAGHTYTEAGTYRVKVTVTDDDGGAASRTVKVVVKAAGGGGSLPLTGSPVARGAGIGLLFMIGGAALLVLGRRRGVHTAA